MWFRAPLSAVACEICFSPVQAAAPSLDGWKPRAQDAGLFSACSRNSKAPGLIRPGQMGANGSTKCSLSLIAEKSRSDAQAYARYVWKATETLVFVCRPKKGSL
jgi:hypothetical protein